MTNITDDLTRTLIMIERALKLRLQLNDLGQAAPGVTLNQAVLLSQIAAAGNLATVSGLSGARKRPVHTLTTAVDGVEKKGLVQRSKIKGEDGRVIRIGLTSEGAAALASFRASLNDMVDYLGTGPLDAPHSGEQMPWVKAMVKLLSAT